MKKFILSDWYSVFVSIYSMVAIVGLWKIHSLPVLVAISSIAVVMAAGQIYHVMNKREGNA